MDEYELTDSNDVLAQLRGGLHQNSRQNLHGGLSEAGDKVGTFSGVTLGSAEAFAVEDSKALLNGLWLHHESGDPGHDIRAVVAGPVAKDALHLAESKLLAGVASSDESGEETVGHVAPPLGKSRLTSSSIRSLGANLGDQDPGLLSDRLGGGHPGQKSSSCGVALFAGGREAGRGKGEGGREQENLHFDWGDFLQEQENLHFD